MTQEEQVEEVLSTEEKAYRAREWTEACLSNCATAARLLWQSSEVAVWAFVTGRPAVETK